MWILICKWFIKITFDCSKDTDIFVKVNFCQSFFRYLKFLKDNSFSKFINMSVKLKFINVNTNLQQLVY